MINECQIINVWHQCLWRRIWFLCLINIFVHISRQPSDVENCHISSTTLRFEKEKDDPIMFRGWTCDTWLGKPLGGTLGKWIMVVIFQIGHSQNRVQKNLTNSIWISPFRNTASVCATGTICVGTNKERCPKRGAAFRMEKNGKMWELFPRVRTPPPSMEPHVCEREKVSVYFAF